MIYGDMPYDIKYVCVSLRAVAATPQNEFEKSVKMNGDTKGKRLPSLSFWMMRTSGVVQWRGQQQQQQQQRHRQKRKHGHRQQHIINDVLCPGQQETFSVCIIFPFHKGISTPSNTQINNIAWEAPNNCQDCWNCLYILKLKDPTQAGSGYEWYRPLRNHNWHTTIHIITT